MAYGSTALADAYGTRPVAPPINTTAPQATAGAINLGQQVYSQLPFYNESLQNVGGNIRSMTAGQLPDDVQRQIAQAAAERGVATGAPGSPNTNAAYLRALGLTSLDLTQKGQQSLLAQLPALPGAQISQNPGFYVNPSQQYEADLQKAIFQAAPEPSAAAAAAMGAAKSGFQYGAGSGGGYAGFTPGAGIAPSSDWWNQPEPNYQPLVAYGPGGGPGSNTANNVGAIVNRYSPTFNSNPGSYEDYNFSSYQPENQNFGVPEEEQFAGDFGGWYGEDYY